MQNEELNAKTQGRKDAKVFPSFASPRLCAFALKFFWHLEGDGLTAARVLELAHEQQDEINFGQVPLEVLDFVVDSRGLKLVGNPAHGGEQMTEEYSGR